MDKGLFGLQKNSVQKTVKIKTSSPSMAITLPVISIRDESDPQEHPLHTSRSCSFRHKQKPIFLQLDNEVIRRHSMPQPSNPRMSSSYNDLTREPLKRVRSFKMTSKGIINKGDSFRRESNASITSTGSTKTDDTSFSLDFARSRLLSDTSEGAESFTSSAYSGYYQVILVGASGVGKTALAKQFLTSEYIGSVDCDEYDEAPLVSVHLDGEESTLEFIDVSDTPETLESINADAYIVVFSVNERSTYNDAISILHHLHEMGSDRTTILVANKIDLARKRIVTSKEARYIAEEYGCKYAEVSVTLNHKVDELLVGIIQQIRLKLNVDTKDSQSVCVRENSVKRLSLSGPKSLFYKLLKKNDRNSKSCDNLYML